MEEWPHFDPALITHDQVSRLGLPIDQVSGLTTVPLPRVIFGERFRLCDMPSTVETTSGTLIEFGSSGPGVTIGLDPKTGEVVQLAGKDKVRTFVNTNLGRFSETARAVINRFPFHATDATEDEIEKAAEAVAKIIRDIDPPAIRPDQFWSTLVDDIGMSDFDLEVMGLSPPQSRSD